jgi:hypothetical protein
MISSDFNKFNTSGIKSLAPLIIRVQKEISLFFCKVTKRCALGGEISIAINK